MSPKIFLVVPPSADPARFPALLEEALDGADVPVILVPRRTLPEAAYKGLAAAVIGVAQPRGCAVLVEGEPRLVRMLKADGLHVTGTIEDLQEAVEALKPAHIVGTIAGPTRHEAMSRGELDVDYLLFGDVDGTADAEMRDLAAWWAETMQVPAVLADNRREPDALGCEFLATAAIWSCAEGPVQALARLGAALEQADA